MINLIVIKKKWQIIRGFNLFCNLKFQWPRLPDIVHFAKFQHLKWNCKCKYRFYGWTKRKITNSQQLFYSQTVRAIYILKLLWNLIFFFNPKVFIFKKMGQMCSTIQSFLVKHTLMYTLWWHRHMICFRGLKSKKEHVLKLKDSFTEQPLNNYSIQHTNFFELLEVALKILNV